MIHKYKLFGKYILLDIDSASVHIVDRITYNLLDYISPPMDSKCPDSILKKFKTKQKTVVEAYSQLYSLYKQNMLFYKEDYSDFIDFYKSVSVKALCLHMAHDCNLKCKYCFASEGAFGGKRSLMSYEVAKASIDYLIKHSNNKHNLEVDFFGGEPLLNYNVITKVVHYARSIEKKYNKNFRFTITTNGLLLDDEKIDFLNREMSNIVLSIDGRKKINDNMRPINSQLGSYDIILPHFKKLVEKRENKDYYVRGTFTRNNLDFSKDIFNLFDNGFKNLSIEPVVANENENYAIRERDLPKIIKQYNKIAKKIIKHKKSHKNINFFHFSIDLNQGPCVIKKIKGCGCGNEYLAVTPQGDLYPCHQFVGKENWIMGNVLKDEPLNKKIKEQFLKTTIYQKEKCNACWAKFYCSGGCNANNLDYAGSIYSPYQISCEMEKKRLECAIAIKACL